MTSGSTAIVIRGKPTKSGSARIMGIVLVNVATLAWATNIVLGSLLRDQIGPLTLAASRFLVAFCMMLVLLQRRPAQERSMGRDHWLLLGMAVTGGSILVSGGSVGI